MSDTAGGLLARRLIPLAILLPILLGALRLVGENVGLYGSNVWSGVCRYGVNAPVLRCDLVDGPLALSG
jgi:hypothetical protein